MLAQRGQTLKSSPTRLPPDQAMSVRAEKVAD
jgi:hypothetical protein